MRTAQHYTYQRFQHRPNVQTPPSSQMPYPTIHAKLPSPHGHAPEYHGAPVHHQIPQAEHGQNNRRIHHAPICHCTTLNSSGDALHKHPQDDATGFQVQRRRKSMSAKQPLSDSRQPCLSLSPDVSAYQPVQNRDIAPQPPDDRYTTPNLHVCALPLQNRLLPMHPPPPQTEYLPSHHGLAKSPSTCQISESLIRLSTTLLHVTNESVCPMCCKHKDPSLQMPSMSQMPLCNPPAQPPATPMKIRHKALNSIHEPSH